jgi:hypothetical protein
MASIGPVLVMVNKRETALLKVTVTQDGFVSGAATGERGDGDRDGEHLCPAGAHR